MSPRIGVVAKMGGVQTLSIGQPRAKARFDKRFSGGERLELALLGEAAQGAPLELAHAFRREAHALGDLAERERIGAADPEAQLDDLASVRVEPLERLADRRLLQLDRDLLERARPLGREHRAELGLAV